MDRGKKESIGRISVKKKIISLKQDAAEVFNCCNWEKPQTTVDGVFFNNKYNNFNKKCDVIKYRENFNKLIENLRDILTNYDHIFTHNPWGEYGHEEHVQVYRALETLQKNNLKYSILFSNYYSLRSKQLMLKYIDEIDDNYFSIETNKNISKEIKMLYEKHNCWTWYKNYQWPNEESYMRLKASKGTESKLCRTLPLNFINIGSPQEKENRFLSKISKKIKYRSIQNMIKTIAKNLLKKAGFKITRLQKEKETNIGKTATLKHEGIWKGNMLLSYIIDPFLLKPGEQISNAHHHDWLSWQIAQTFLNLGYAVDVIDYRDKKFVPQKKYAFFVGARTNFQRIAQLLNGDCLKIVHLDTAHWLFNNHASYSRSLDLQQRKGVTITRESQRIVESNLAIEYADYATTNLGNQFNVSTYSYAKKPIFQIYLPTFTVYPGPEKKDYETCRKNFVWFGSNGFVHKGLDLVLEAFAVMSDYHLYVIGPIHSEKRFEKLYYKELYQTSNIHAIGWVDIESSKFIEITNNCIGTIFPSCSEGGGASAITCMQAGLIPIVSYESNVEVNDFGWTLKECSKQEIIKTVESVTALPPDVLKEKAKRSWDFARTHHTKKKFAENYGKVIQKIISDNMQDQ